MHKNRPVLRNKSSSIVVTTVSKSAVRAVGITCIVWGSTVVQLRIWSWFRQCQGNGGDSQDYKKGEL